MGLAALTTRGSYKNVIRDFYLDNNLIEVLEKEKTVSDIAIESEEDLFNEVKDVLEKVIKHNIEKRRWIAPFWNKYKKLKIDEKKIEIPSSPKKETDIQPTIWVFLQELLLKKGITIIKESDEGIGSLDFRCVYNTPNGEILNVAIEFKIAHHKKLKDGILKQLPAYLESMRAKHGIFLVLWFRDAKGKYFNEPKGYSFEETKEYFDQLSEKVSSEKDLKIDSIFIDASVKLSASNL